MTLASQVLPVRAELGEPPREAPGLYVLHCSGCHGMDGAGVPTSIPDIRTSLPRLLASPAGRDYVLHVPGVARSDATPAQLAAILNWVNASLTTTSAAAKPFTADEIAAARQTPLTDPAAVRRAVLNDDTY